MALHLKVSAVMTVIAIGNGIVCCIGVNSVLDCCLVLFVHIIFKNWFKKCPFFHLDAADGFVPASVHLEP